ncbi:MAG: DUF423 domain-containing protein [Planctomycetes bacterium]|nr:DUF423 domain-containing protein [Planctomycetota bacterium]
MTPRRMIALGAAFAGLAVAAGAFGAHAMKHLPAADLDIWEKAARYQMYHALGLLACGALGHAGHAVANIRFAAWSFLTGIALFSGSLYLLVATGQRWLGAVTPFGGVAFLLGWGALAWPTRTSSRPSATA